MPKKVAHRLRLKTEIGALRAKIIIIEHYPDLNGKIETSYDGRWWVLEWTDYAGKRVLDFLAPEFIDPLAKN